MQALRVVIPDDAAAKLDELAHRQYRAPRQQAAVLLVEAIERADLGAATPDTPAARAGVRSAAPEPAR